MTTSIIAVQETRDGSLDLVEVDLPAPKAHEVLVRMEASGVCQSQLMWMGRDRDAPVLFGHEGIGRVEEVGSEVRDLIVNDHVLVTWLPRVVDRPVDRCGVSLPNGDHALSPNVYTWATKALIDEAYVRRLPDDVKDVNACIVGCAVITGAGAVINVGKVKEGDNVVVIGAGGVGLSAVAAASYQRAARIIVVDLVASKLDLARTMGATHVIDASEVDPTERMKEILGGGADYVFDCVAAPATVSQSIAMLRAARPAHNERGGIAVMVGVPKQQVEVNLFDLMSAGTSLTGTLAGSCSQEQIDDFLDWWRKGKLDLNSLVTDSFDFTEIALAADALATGRVVGRAIVVMHHGDDHE